MPVIRGKSDVKIVVLKEPDIGADEFTDDLEQCLVKDKRPKKRDLRHAVWNGPAANPSPPAGQINEFPDQLSYGIFGKDIFHQNVTALVKLRHVRHVDGENCTFS